jgi:UTP--glucose-1-phosphate uridylyltransferase
MAMNMSFNRALAVNKVVITAAGIGTRLLPATKETPKEMLPLFSINHNGELCLKPVLQLIFEQLYNVGFRNFCFVVGRGKRSIEDHFNKNSTFINYLREKGKHDLAEELDSFYRKLDSSNIVFVNQPEPLGFGDAVYRARIFTLNEPFLLHAGDDLILSNDNSYIRRLIDTFTKMECDATFLVERVQDPRKYGVINGVEIEPGIYRVIDIVEKPEKPPSNIAAIAIYVFNEKIYKAIEMVKPDRRGEIQLTDAIKNLILNGGKVYSVELLPHEKRIDVGTPESYWIALEKTFKSSVRGI